MALPRLCGRVIDLEYPQTRIRVTVGEGIKSGAEHNILIHSPGHSAGELVFSIAAARNHERPKSARERGVFFRTEAKLFGGLGADDGQREGINKDLGVIEKLVSGAAHGHPLGGSAEFTFLHPAVRYVFCLHSWQGQTSRRNFHE